jgi:Xaa-Pro aminopeptidase
VAGALSWSLALQPATAQIQPAEYGARRAALAARLDDGVFLARGGEEPALDYQHFIQVPGFEYLTGYREAGAAVVMSKRGGTVTWWLFVQRKNPAMEVWSGVRNGPLQASRLTGMITREDRELSPVLDSLLAVSPRLQVLYTLAEGGDTLNGDGEFVRQLRERHPQVRLAAANGHLQALRATKSAAELELLRKSIAITLDAVREAMRAAEPGMNEFELQALVEYTFRRNGADRPGYASIVGAGPNGTTLHYNRDDRFLDASDLIVMDVGALYQGYSADITRTFPASGSFSPEQREVYQIVRDAQNAAERLARPEASWQSLDDAARRALARGLAALGLIEGEDATYECGAAVSAQRCPQLSLFYMHGLGHGIGLEVHDPDAIHLTGVIKPGSAFTLEPGLYVRENLLDLIPDRPGNRRLRERLAGLLPRYRNIGVRIEDDYLVTERGVEWASCGLPREIAEIEALMREPYAGPAPRDSAKVNWYQSRTRGQPSAQAVRAAGCQPTM